MTRTGRRPGNVDTRGEILRAARREFADHGFAGATVRRIAGAAGVDPALVHHYFRTKRGLFAATMELPFEADDLVAAATDGENATAGERLVRRLLEVWADERGRALTQSMLRSAVGDEEVLRQLREFMLEAVLLPIVSRVAPDHHRLRASLLATQGIGLAMVRHVARVEPLASASADTVVACVAPSVQRYLTGDLGI